MEAEIWLTNPSDHQPNSLSLGAHLNGLTGGQSSNLLSRRVATNKRPRLWSC